MSLLPEALLLPQQTLARRGAVLALGAEALRFGPSGLLVHGASLLRTDRLDRIAAACPKAMRLRFWRQQGGEPTTAEVDALRAELRRDRPDWIAAVGGGSVIDLAKAAAGLLDAPEGAAFYQRHPAAIPPAALPLIAAPTTAGTGSEATVVAVLTDEASAFKQSIRHPTFMPRTVLLDPDLLDTCPPQIIATAGLDAFVQAYESFVSRHATSFTRELSLLALRQIADNLQPVYDGDNARADALLQASYIAGLAFSHARLGIVHGMAHPLGVRWHAAHGLVCASCLPAALAFNRPACGAALAELEARTGIDLEACVSGWLDHFRLQSPFAGQPIRDRDAIIAETLVSGSTAANPRKVDAQDVADLLDRIFAAPGS